jgi:hypothetical protein
MLDLVVSPKNPKANTLDVVTRSHIKSTVYGPPTFFVLLS